MNKISNPGYLAQVKLLSKDETERLLSRMSGKLPRRLEKEKISQDEALAIQLELEDEQLQEWREVMSKLKNAEAAKSAAKIKQSKSSEANTAEKIKKPKKEAKAEKKAVDEKTPLVVPKLASLPKASSVPAEKEKNVTATPSSKSKTVKK
jgi:hypothetical protein